MKKKYYLANAMLLTVFSLSGCTDDTITEGITKNEDGNGAPKHELSFVADIEPRTSDSPSTRTELSEDNNVNWIEGDKIHLWNENNLGEGKDVDFTYSGSNSVFNGSMEAEDGNGLYAFYPAPVSNMKVSFASGNFTFTSPALQSYKAGSFATDVNPMVASVTYNSTASNTTLPFKNVCGILKMKLKTANDGKQYTLDYILVSHQNDEPMINKIIATPNGTGEPTLKMEESTDTSIKLDCGAMQLTSTETDFYIVLPVENYTDAKISFHGKCEGKEAVNTISNCKFNIQRSKITSMPAKEILTEESGSIVDGKSAVRIGDYAIKLNLTDINSQLVTSRKYFLAIGDRTGTSAFLVKMPGATQWQVNSSTTYGTYYNYNSSTQILYATYCNAFPGMVATLQPLEGKVTTCYIEDWGTGTSCVNAKAFSFNYDATTTTKTSGYGTVTRTGEFTLKIDFTNIKFIDYSCYGVNLLSMGQIMSNNHTASYSTTYSGSAWSSYSYPGGHYYSYY